jgi:hypothetical protein
MVVLGAPASLRADFRSGVLMDPPADVLAWTLDSDN